MSKSVLQAGAAEANATALAGNQNDLRSSKVKTEDEAQGIKPVKQEEQVDVSVARQQSEVDLRSSIKNEDVNPPESSA